MYIIDKISSEVDTTNNKTPYFSNKIEYINEIRKMQLNSIIIILFMYFIYSRLVYLFNFFYFM